MRAEEVVSEPEDPIAAVSHADPYPYYRRLREAQPLYFDDRLDLWVASSAGIVTTILQHAAGCVRPVTQPVPPALAKTEIGPIYGSLIRMTDGDYQRQMKGVVVAALAQIDCPTLQSTVAEAVALLDLPNQGDLPTVLRATQYRLPAYVVARLLGIETGLCRDIAALVGQFVGAVAAGVSDERIDHGCAATRHLLAMFDAACVVQATGRPNLLVALLHRSTKAGLTPANAMANAIGLLMQTFDAAAGLIGNGFLALARLQDVTSETAWPAFIEEVLRCDAPVQNTRRVIAQETGIGGQVLKAEDTVLLVLAAANRDPTLNTDPDAFRLDRPDRRIMTFGAGHHVCPGQLIAKTIAAAALRTLWPIWRGRPEVQQVANHVTYRSLPNARIPEFAT